MLGAGDETVNMHQRKDDPLPIGWFALFTPSDTMPRDRGLYFRRRALIMGVGILVLAAAWGLSQSSSFVESTYAEGFGQSVGRGLATVTGGLPTSVAEVVLILVGGWFFFLWVRAAWHVARRKRRALNAIACGVLHLGAFATVTLALFYVFWGINYSRAPFIEREGWEEFAEPPEDREAQAEELSELCEQLVETTNDYYVLAMGSEDYGQPSAPRTEMANLDDSIDVGYERLVEDLDLHESVAHSRGPAKPVALSEIMNYLQIGGFYFPWTGEANYNRKLPAVSIPFVIAHEKAHQRCVTSEDESNFYGFMACIRSDDPYVRYSGYLFAQRQLLFELLKLDQERGKELLAERAPGVQRDVNAIREYWAQYDEGVAKQVGEASRTVNDTYLKSHGVDGGVQSYRMSAKLLIVYARKTGAIVYAPEEE